MNGAGDVAPTTHEEDGTPEQPGEAGECWKPLPVLLAWFVINGSNGPLDLGPFPGDTLSPYGPPFSEAQNCSV